MCILNVLPTDTSPQAITSSSEIQEHQMCLYVLTKKVARLEIEESFAAMQYGI